MAEEKKERKPMYGHASSKRAGDGEKHEGKPPAKKMEGEGKEKEPQAGPAEHPHKAVYHRHHAEREAMHKAHETERRDFHGNHREELRKMAARHGTAHKELAERHMAELQQGAPGAEGAVAGAEAAPAGGPPAGAPAAGAPAAAAA